MGLRPGRTIRALERPWTRYSSKKTKSYVPTLPPTKIKMYIMGENTDFDTKLNLVAESSGQIRDNAIEAARVVSHNFLEKKLAKNYFFKILLYPHQIIREKPIAEGAGADRYSRGMKLAFGKPVGKALQVKKGQIIMILKTQKAYIELGKEALKRTSSKLSVPTRIVVEE